MALKVAKAKVVALFVQLGLKTASSWSDAELQKRIKTLPKVVDEDTDKVKDKKQMDLLKALLKAVNDKADVILDGDAKTEPTKTESKKPVKKEETYDLGEDEDEEDEDESDESDEEESDEEDEEESEPDEEEDEEEEEVATKPAKKPVKAEKPAAKEESKKSEPKKPPVAKKVGVIQTIIKCLAKGSKEKPCTKDDIMKVLVKKFGPGTEANRDEKAMKSTVNSQVPSGLKTEKNITLERNDEGGFWLNKSDKAKWAPDAEPSAEKAESKKPAKAGKK